MQLKEVLPPIDSMGIFSRGRVAGGGGFTVIGYIGYILGLYRGYIGIMENKMETTIMGLNPKPGFYWVYVSPKAHQKLKALNPKALNPVNPRVVSIFFSIIPIRFIYGLGYLGFI